MSAIAEMLFSRLGERDMLAVEINRLIKDVSYAVYQENAFAANSLKQSLQHLGWEEHILDYRTLELICLVLEDETCLHTLLKKTH